MYHTTLSVEHTPKVAQQAPNTTHTTPTVDVNVPAFLQDMTVQEANTVDKMERFFLFLSCKLQLSVLFNVDEATLSPQQREKKRQLHHNPAFLVLSMRLRDDEELMAALQTWSDKDVGMMDKIKTMSVFGARAISLQDSIYQWCVDIVQRLFLVSKHDSENRYHQKPKSALQGMPAFQCIYLRIVVQVRKSATVQIAALENFQDAKAIQVQHKALWDWCRMWHNLQPPALPFTKIQKAQRSILESMPVFRAVVGLRELASHAADETNENESGTDSQSTMKPTSDGERVGLEQSIGNNNEISSDGGLQQHSNLAGCDGTIGPIQHGSSSSSSNQSTPSGRGVVDGLATETTMNAPLLTNATHPSTATGTPPSARDNLGPNKCAARMQVPRETTPERAKETLHRTSGGVGDIPNINNGTSVSNPIADHAVQQTYGKGEAVPRVVKAGLETFT
jgi:hypothetical protein